MSESTHKEIEDWQYQVKSISERLNYIFDVAVGAEYLRTSFPFVEPILYDTLDRLFVTLLRQRCKDLLAIPLCIGFCINNEYPDVLIAEAGCSVLRDLSDTDLSMLSHTIRAIVQSKPVALRAATTVVNQSEKGQFWRDWALTIEQRLRWGGALPYRGYFDGGTFDLERAIQDERLGDLYHGDLPKRSKHGSSLDFADLFCCFFLALNARKVKTDGKALNINRFLEHFEPVFKRYADDWEKDWPYHKQDAVKTACLMPTGRRYAKVVKYLELNRRNPEKMLPRPLVKLLKKSESVGFALPEDWQTIIARAKK